MRDDVGNYIWKERACKLYIEKGQWKLHINQEYSGNYPSIEREAIEYLRKERTG